MRYPIHYEITARAGLTTRTAVSTVKREAIRVCRRMTRALGPDASGEVRTAQNGLLYQCHLAIVRGRAVLVVEEL